MNGRMDGHLMEQMEPVKDRCHLCGQISTSRHRSSSLARVNLKYCVAHSYDEMTRTRNYNIPLGSINRSVHYAAGSD